MLLDVAVLASLVLALYVTTAGAVRVKLGSAVVFSVRGALRPWLLSGLFVLLRLATARRRSSEGPGRARLWLGAASKWWRTRRPDTRTFYGLLTFVSLWLSTGPLAGLWPRVYWLPGLSFIRVPSRFSLLALLGVAVLAGMGFERLSATMSSKARATLAAFVGALLIAEFAALPLQTVPYRVQIPAIDRWLAGQPKPFAVAELPFGNPGEPGRLGAAAHRGTCCTRWRIGRRRSKAIVACDLHVTKSCTRGWCTFPDEDSLRSLRDLGVDYVVLHTDLYPPTNGRESTLASRCSRRG